MVQMPVCGHSCDTLRLDLFAQHPVYDSQLVRSSPGHALTSKTSAQTVPQGRQPRLLATRKGPLTSSEVEVLPSAPCPLPWDPRRLQEGAPAPFPGPCGPQGAGPPHGWGTDGTGDRPGGGGVHYLGWQTLHPSSCSAREQ